jgi:hypothetical protein
MYLALDLQSIAAMRRVHVERPFRDCDACAAHHAEIVTCHAVMHIDLAGQIDGVDASTRLRDIPELKMQRCKFNICKPRGWTTSLAKLPESSPVGLGARASSRSCDRVSSEQQRVHM